jgi:chromosome segregation ATPase
MRTTIRLSLKTSIRKYPFPLFHRQCFSLNNDKNDLLKNKYINLQISYNDLLHTNEELLDSNEEYRDQIAELTSENEELMNNINELENTIDKMIYNTSKFSDPCECDADKD